MFLSLSMMFAVSLFTRAEFYPRLLKRTKPSCCHVQNLAQIEVSFARLKHLHHPATPTKDNDKMAILTFLATGHGVFTSVQI